MYRPTRSKVPVRESHRVGNFGKAKLQKIFEQELKGVPKVVKYAQRSETCYCLSDGDITVVSPSGSCLSVKLKSKGKASLFSVRADDKLMAVCVDSKTIEIVDLDKRKSISSFEVERDVLCMAYTLSGHISVVTASEYTLFDSIGQIKDSKAFDYVVENAYIVADSKLLVRTSNNYSYLCVSEEGSTFSLDSKSIECAAASSSRLVTSSGGCMTIYSIEEKKKIATLRPHAKSITFMEVSQDSSLVYSASLDGFLTVTNLISGKTKHVMDAGSPILTATRKSDVKFLLGLSNGKVFSYGKHQRSDSPVLQGASNHQLVIKLLKSFKYRMALLECLNSTSTEQFMSVMTMLNYNGHLKHVVDTFSSSELSLFASRLCKISIKSRISPVLVESMRYAVETDKLDIDSLKAIRLRLSDLEAIQSSFSTLSADLHSLVH